MFALIALIAIMSSCNTVKKTMWVSGFKTNCDNGAGKSECLVVEKSGDEKGNKWTNFYAPIQGFEFKEGTMQKIRVKEEKIDKESTAQDDSNIRYTLIKVLSTQPDVRASLNGEWHPVQINGNNLPKQDYMPTLNFNMMNNAVYGTDGCNNYKATIADISLSILKLKPAAGTKKACPDMTTANVFNQALASVEKYSVTKDELKLIDKFGKVRMILNRGEGYTQNSLSGAWIAARIQGSKINKSVKIPTLEMNLADGIAVGNDGCNNYRIPILNSSGSRISFGVMAGTEKMCANMGMSDEFDKALIQSVTYKIDGDMLTMYDASGNEVLAFLRRN